MKTMTQDTKDRIADLERQKIELNNQLEFLGYSGNLVRMHKIEEEVFEIEDTIQKYFWMVSSISKTSSSILCILTKLPE